ncbi:alpha/beta hydrolase [Williamsia sp. M5A3_1d]
MSTDVTQRTVTYGDHADQHIAVRQPSADPRWTAVLIHGGYWRTPYRLDLMDPMADSLAAAGVAVWNVEYRRPDSHGWAATTADVAAALAAVEADGPIAVIGHSAGGQLALRVAADTDRPVLGVSLAGVIDLETADERGMGDGAVANALGHRFDPRSPDDVASSPRHRLPLGVPQVIACGTDDDPNLVDISADYVQAATAAGDEVATVTAPGDHFAIIDPSTRLWAATLAAIERELPL